MLLWMWGCGASRSTSTATNDTYLTAKERARLNQQAQQSSTSGGDVDARADNYDASDRSARRRDWEDDDYYYTRQVRRYSTGVWYDPWFDPWCSPSWAWRSAWWGPSWGWGWNTGWAAMPGWYYTPGWGWTYYAGYWGPTYYAGPVWYDRGWTSSAPARRLNYAPRTYTAPRGNTIYTPPRSGAVGSSTTTPPRRTTAPAPTTRPSSSPSVRPSSAPSSPRPSMSSGSTGGGIRTSSGTTRPR